MDYSPPGFSVHGILQTRILEWVAIPFPGDLPDPGIELGSPALQADSLPSKSPGKCLPVSRSFLVSRLFPSGGQSIGASVSASVFLINIQG